jgi:pullulanase/glycogen debranching enzyme
LRRALPALRQDDWLDDHPHADGRREVQWVAPARDGDTVFRPMALEDWHDAHRHALALWLAPRDDAAVLVLMNAEGAPVRFVLPPGPWVQRLDSAGGDTQARALDGIAVEAPASGLLVLVSEPHRC